MGSRATRERNYDQLKAYLSALESAARPAAPLPADYRSESSFLRSVEPLREKLKGLIGYPPPGFDTKPALHLQKIGEDDLATYYRATVDVTPEMQVYGLYLVPRKAKLPAPLVISQHGGGGFPELALFRGGASYHDMIRGAVKEGHVVWAPLLVMYPYQDRDHSTPIPEKVREQLDERMRARGTSLVAVELMKIQRSLDALLERPEIDRRRIAMVGFSYGGFYTLYAMAVEPRIVAGVASCSMRRLPAPGSMDDLARTRPTGRLDFIPQAELLALICPRHLQIQSGIQDPLLPIDDARDITGIGKQYWAGLGRESAFDFQPFEGKHEWNGELAWTFLRRVFTVSGRPR